MPNITIYLNDEEYSNFMGLSKDDQKELRQKAKERIVQ